MKLIAKNIHSDSCSKRWSIVDENNAERATVYYFENIFRKNVDFSVSVISESTLLPYVCETFASLTEALSFVRKTIDNEPEPTVESLETGLATLKNARYLDEMSDDLSYSNGKYARWTQKIQIIEKKLTALKSALV